MIYQPDTKPAPPEGEAQTTPEPTWHDQIGRLLTEAAAICVEHGLDVDGFMRSAWLAYLEARPGMREQLEDIALRNELEEVRKTGRMAKA